MASGKLTMENYLTTSRAKRTSATGLLVTIAVTYPVWITTDEISPSPFLGLFHVENFIHWMLTAIIVAWTAYTILSPKGSLQGLILLLLFLVSCTLDINRCQVWLLHFVYVLLLPENSDEKDSSVPVLFMISITYVFSGIQKFNIGFVQETLPWLMKPIGITGYSCLQLVIPICEMLLGAAMLLPRISRWVSICAMIMHVIIIYILFYYQWNLSVVPWNLVMIIFHSLLVIKGESREGVFDFRVIPLMCSFLAITILGYIGLIPRQFSFQLYSGNQYTGIVVFSEESFDKLPNHVKVICEKLNRTQEPFLNLDRYAMQQLGVPLFQSIGSYKEVARGFVKYSNDADDLVLLVRNGPEFIFEKDLWAFTIADLNTGKQPN